MFNHSTTVKAHQHSTASLRLLTYESPLRLHDGQQQTQQPIHQQQRLRQGRVTGLDTGGWRCRAGKQEGSAIDGQERGSRFAPGH